MSTTAPQDHPNLQDLHLAQKAFAKGNNELSFKLLNKIKSTKVPTRGTDLLRAKIFLKSKQIEACYQALLEDIRLFPDNEEAVHLLEQIKKERKIHLPKHLGDTFFRSIFEKISNYTMLSQSRLFSLYSHAKRICTQDIAGNFVECGVAAGGSTALLAATIKEFTKRPRYIYAFDSFCGMPPPGINDTSSQGIHAESTGWGTGTCAAPVECVMEITSQLDALDFLCTVKGYFEDTLHHYSAKISEIALLHMDGDWYESTKTILNTFYSSVIDGGIIQVDDYGYWAGCKKALNEFERDSGITLAVNAIDSTGVWITKTTHPRLRSLHQS